MRMKNLMTALCMATALAGQPIDIVWAQNAKIDQRSINFHSDAKKAMEKGDFKTAQIQSARTRTTSRRATIWASSTSASATSPVARRTCNSPCRAASSPIGRSRTTL
jgi:hypothetical protein